MLRRCKDHGSSLNTDTPNLLSNVLSVSRITRNLFPSLRRARWRRWLVITALVCVVGIFSIGVTHHHQTLAAELACPVCHITAHGSPDLLHVDTTPAASFAGWYRHALPHTNFVFAPSRFNLTPPARAPPASVSSLI